MSIAKETVTAVVSKDEAAPAQEDAKSSGSSTEVKELVASLR